MTRLLCCPPLLALALAAACDPTTTDEEHLEPITVWETMESGAITEVGVSLDLAALLDDQGDDEHAEHEHVDVALPFSEDVQSQTWIKLLQLNYGPQGHGPPGVNDVPHFDVHLYTVNDAARRDVTCDDQPMPDADQLPEGVVVRSPAPTPEGSCVLEMGVHGQNPTAGVYDAEGKLEYVMTYGFDRGKLTFLEPMIHMENIELQEPITMDVQIPPTFNDGPTRYPTKFSGRPNAETGTYDFVAHDFVDVE